MKKEDFKKGQKVWLCLVGDAARHCNTPEDRVQEYEVVSVGRKYITVNKTGLSTSWDIKFDIKNNFRQVYTYGSTEYILFLTKDEAIYLLSRNLNFGKILRGLTARPRYARPGFSL